MREGAGVDGFREPKAPVSGFREPGAMVSSLRFQDSGEREAKAWE